MGSKIHPPPFQPPNETLSWYFKIINKRRLYSLNNCRFPQVQFNYQDPSRNFNRDKVKGPVAKLIRVNDVSAATALEVTAGSKVRRSPELTDLYFE